MQQDDVARSLANHLRELDIQLRKVIATARALRLLRPEGRGRLPA
jgi:hypothetical protein